MYVPNGSWILKIGLGTISTVQTRNMILSKKCSFGSKVRFIGKESEHIFQIWIFPIAKVPFGSPKKASGEPLGCLFGSLGGLSGASGVSWGVFCIFSSGLSLLSL